MINLGGTDFYFHKTHLSKKEIEEYSLLIFDEWEKNISDTIIIPDYALHLQINEGSILGKGNIYTKLGALYVAIGLYGSFISGLETISKQLKYASNTLVSVASDFLPTNTETPTVKRKTAVLGSLRNLFLKVQNGSLSAEDAIYQAEILLKDQKEESPEFIEYLNKSLSEAPLFHKQENLPFEEENDDPIFPINIPKNKNRNDSPVIPIYQLQINVWRDSKDDKRKVKILDIPKNKSSTKKSSRLMY